MLEHRQGNKSAITENMRLKIQNRIVKGPQ